MNHETARGSVKGNERYYGFKFRFLGASAIIKPRIGLTSIFSSNDNKYTCYPFNIHWFY